MSKRFTDTDKWKKVWFRKLAPELKLFWFYMLDNCNHAGIWEVDIDMANFTMMTNLTQKDLLEAYNGHITRLSDGSKWFVNDFITFQYGELNHLNRAHRSVLLILMKYPVLNKLFINEIKPLTRPLQGRKDKDKDKDMDMDKDKNKDYIPLSQWWYNVIEGEFGNHKSVKMAKEDEFSVWANELRLIVEQDKISLEDIEKALGWGRDNSFWKRQIISIGGLRNLGKNGNRKIQNLIDSMNSEQNKPLYGNSNNAYG